MATAMPYHLLSHSTALGLAIILVCIVFRCRKKSSNLPLPPGPRKLPLLGNALDIPSGFEWEAFTRWGKEFNSDIIHLNAAGTSMIILNSVRVARDLMEKRSSIYSSRPKLTVVNKLMGFSWLLPFMPYGSAWKERRRLFQRHFHPSNDLMHKPFELEQSRHLLLQILEKPEDYMAHVQHAVGASLLNISYGIKARPTGEPAIILAERVAKYLADSITPWTMVFDKLPFLLPVVSPFLSSPIFSRTRKYWEDLIIEFRDDPVVNVQNQIASGSAESSFVSNALEDLSTNSEEMERQIKDVAGVVFIGGSSTTNALLHTFFLTMIEFPEAQAKAHAELDEIVGRERLPDFEDAKHLPYLDALLKEINRWRPAGPIGKSFWELGISISSNSFITGIPHYLEEDDEYDGYLIPGQSVVIGNAWAMLNDEEDYPDPSTFKPERFLKNGAVDPSVRDPSTVSFGFGRRACPGAHIAQSTIWIIAASILSVFEISSPVDEHGRVVRPSGEYVTALTFQPLPFKCTIRSRHEEAAGLICASQVAS